MPGNSARIRGAAFASHAVPTLTDEPRWHFRDHTCDRTQSQIAEEFGVSQMRISLLLSRICARLARDIDAD